MIVPNRNHSGNFLHLTAGDTRYDQHYATNRPDSGHNDDYQTLNSTPAQTPAHSPSRPLRSRLNQGLKGVASPYRLRVYALNGGRELLGYALSETTLKALMETGYLKASTVEVSGTILGQPVNTVIHEFDYCKALRQVI